MSALRTQTETIADPSTQKLICDPCEMVYDPGAGDLDRGIPPGTPFQDIPDSWMCPVCGAHKNDFTPYED